MMIACPECKKEYSDQSKQCVHCGARNPNRMSGGLKFATIVMALICVFLALVLIGNQAYDPEQDSAERAIANCRDSVDDELLGVDARRLARDTCELMEQRYKDKYGRAP